MKSPAIYRNRQRTVVFVTLLLFELVLVLLQLWLFVSTLEALLSGRSGMAVPAAAASIACLAVNLWMLIGVYRVDKEK